MVFDFLRSHRHPCRRAGNPVGTGTCFRSSLRLPHSRPSGCPSGSAPGISRGLSHSASPRGTDSLAATTGSHSRGLCSRPWGALLPHFWRESYNALRVRPHAMTDQLPGGRLWDINGLQSQKGPLSPDASLMQYSCNQGWS